MRSQHITEESPTPEGIVVPLDLEEFVIVKQEVQADGSIEVEVRARAERASCPYCQRLCVKVHDTRLRRKRDRAVREYRVVLVVHKRRFRCVGCQRSFTEPDQACGRRRRTTRRLREYVGKQALTRPISHVAAERGVGPRLVQQCLEQVAQSKLAEYQLSVEEGGPLPTPRYLGIDEFARRKGHRYDTILCDLEGRRVLEVSAGRTKDEVSHLLERLDHADAVEAVSMDMSSPFREAVQLTLPRARIVADHFHVIQHVSKAFKKVLTRWAATVEGKQALPGHLHLFLRPREDLSADEEQQRAALAVAFPEIDLAWRLKEALRTWYATSSATTAAQALERWIALVEAAGPPELRKALSAFRTWRAEILAFFDFLPTRISNGFVEGKNNRTKTLMRQGYGYRNRHNLRLRILLGVAT